jgi:hypothetical protein
MGARSWGPDKGYKEAEHALRIQPDGCAAGQISLDTPCWTNLIGASLLHYK